MYEKIFDKIIVFCHKILLHTTLNLELNHFESINRNVPFLPEIEIRIMVTSSCI